MVNMVQLKVKLGKVGNSLRITIPKPIADQLKWQAGDILAVDVTDTAMIAKKVKE